MTPRETLIRCAEELADQFTDEGRKVRVGVVRELLAALATETAQRDAAERELAEWRAALDELHVVNWTNLDADKLSPRDAVRSLLEKALDVERDELRTALAAETAQREAAERAVDDAEAGWVRIAAQNAEDWKARLAEAQEEIQQHRRHRIEISELLADAGVTGGTTLYGGVLWLRERAEKAEAALTEARGVIAADAALWRVRMAGRR